jgi:hypothetical protein
MNKMIKLLTISLLFGGMGLVAAEEGRRVVEQLSNKILSEGSLGSPGLKDFLEISTITSETQDVLEKTKEMAIPLLYKLEQCNSKWFEHSKKSCRNNAAGEYGEALKEISNNNLSLPHKYLVVMHGLFLGVGVKEFASK